MYIENTKYYLCLFSLQLWCHTYFHRYKQDTWLWMYLYVPLMKTNIRQYGILFAYSSLNFTRISFSLGLKCDLFIGFNTACHCPIYINIISYYISVRNNIRQYGRLWPTLHLLISNIRIFKYKNHMPEILKRLGAVALWNLL